MLVKAIILAQERMRQQASYPPSSTFQPIRLGNCAYNVNALPPSRPFAGINGVSCGAYWKLTQIHIYIGAHIYICTYSFAYNIYTTFYYLVTFYFSC